MTARRSGFAKRNEGLPLAIMEERIWIESKVF